MLKVLTAEQMREVDRLTTERYGIPSIILMENAAHAVASVITEKLGGSVKGKSILILCGKGNNGGDGAALARILAAAGSFVSCILFGKVANTKGDARTNFEILRNTDFDTTAREGDKEKFRYHKLWFEEVGSIGEWLDEYADRLNPDCIVDALFGTGLSREIGREYERILATGWFRPDLQKREKPILRVAVDIPSGILADSGLLIGPHATVDVTVTFTAPKMANILPDASNCNGEVTVADIGTPPILVDLAESQNYLADRQNTEFFVNQVRFRSSSYKNKRGHALVIAGSEDYSGAAVLAGNAAMRSGVGLVTLAVSKAVKSEVAARALPDLIVRAFDDGKFEAKADAILIGCGLDANDSANAAMFHKIVSERSTPVIVDAGALWFVPSLADKDVREPIEAPLILTPHEGEFLRLLGTDDKSVIEDRVAAVRNYATANNVILVLKG
ncbi:MAG TPA: NAD(P)H-hydrate epimerase, partial [Pyrinomonadaceae bacterium]|nr:NAD(P)H-hydrate epimerase [Pyrinomonadaceae bacterium]